MDDLPKITLSSSRSRLNSSSNTTRMWFPKKTIFIVGILFLFIVGSIFAVVLPAQKTYSSAQKTYKQAQKALEGAKKQNVVVASEELAKTKEALIETQNNLNALSFLRFVPLVAWYYNYADHLLKAGF